MVLAHVIHFEHLLVRASAGISSDHVHLSQALFLSIESALRVCGDRWWIHADLLHALDLLFALHFPVPHVVGALPVL